jgi:hypothetical protein
MKKPNPISVIFGIIQTALYVDFAWVYWSRQRVKLRNGGIVDADDLSRGWLLRRIFGNKQFARDIDGDATDDEESAPALGGRSNNNQRGGVPRPKWGSRGISISADEGVLEQDREHEQGVTDASTVDPDAKMRDPDELARALDEEEDEDLGALQSSSSSSSAQQSKTAHTDSNKGQPSTVPSGVRSGEEWDDD